MSVRLIPHCAIRAKERYGIDLSWHDVEAISARCAGGEGRTERNADGSQFHIIIFSDRVLWIVYRPPETSGRTHGVIVTVMPPEVGAIQAARDSAHAARRRGDYRPRRRTWR